jgi:hypothetical protein
MQPHQQRVVDEKTELDEKLSKLESFFETNIFKSIPEQEQLRLKRQAIIMAAYSDILQERITAF